MIHNYEIKIGQYTVQRVHSITRMGLYDIHKRRQIDAFMKNEHSSPEEACVIFCTNLHHAYVTRREVHVCEQLVSVSRFMVPKDDAPSLSTLFTPSRECILRCSLIMAAYMCVLLFLFHNHKLWSVNGCLLVWAIAMCNAWEQLELNRASS